MSKPIARVTLVILISLALIAATYITVQGALPRISANNTGVHVVSGLQTNLNHYRVAASDLQSLQSMQPANQTGKGHDCDSEARMSPDD